ncbi:imidazole glycerol phosphate synthase subunit HisH [Luteimonas vadosa]|uniref:Imidazole glycerol phosphate synthase subunit HisH n=2 Tax=Luteimonas vadosa TaxID=1165507 RepID=A0ABP9E7I7_9GAMM
MDVAVIDAGGANLGSVCYALERLGAVPRIVRDADALAGAVRIVLPGVGAARPAMRALRKGGFDIALRDSEIPLLGICLGMQLLFEHSEEGDTACLGLLPGVVRRMLPGPGVRVPHMGWNRLRPLREDPLLAGIEDGAFAYFVHGYAVLPDAHAIAGCRHGDVFSAVVRRANVAGAQFHPERSATCGARILRNFVGVPA